MLDGIVESRQKSRAAHSAPSFLAQLSQHSRVSTERKEMMSALRKALVVLFVLLSALLFTAFLPLVLSGLAAFYGYQYSSASPAPAMKCEDRTPSAPAVRPFYTAIKSYMSSGVSSTAGLTLSVTAAIFLTIGLIIFSTRQVAQKIQALA